MSAIEVMATPHTQIMDMMLIALCDFLENRYRKANRNASILFQMKKENEFLRKDIHSLCILFQQFVDVFDVV